MLSGILVIMDCRRENISSAVKHQNLVIWKCLFINDGARKMAADSSFDVTLKIDRMELDNAINQAIREIETRFGLILLKEKMRPLQWVARSAFKYGRLSSNF